VVLFANPSTTIPVIPQRNPRSNLGIEDFLYVHADVLGLADLILPLASIVFRACHPMNVTDDMRNAPNVNQGQRKANLGINTVSTSYLLQSFIQMTTVTVTRKNHSWPGSSTAAGHPRAPIEDLLLKVGKRVLKGELHSDPMTLTQVTRIAQKYKIPWENHTHKAKVLKEEIETYFKKQSHIRGDGVAVDCFTLYLDYKPALIFNFHS
jgi:putative transposon-encoded protein